MPLKIGEQPSKKVKIRAKLASWKPKVGEDFCGSPPKALFGLPRTTVAGFYFSVFGGKSDITPPFFRLSMNVKHTDKVLELATASWMICRGMARANTSHTHIR